MKFGASSSSCACLASREGKLNFSRRQQTTSCDALPHLPLSQAARAAHLCWAPSVKQQICLTPLSLSRSLVNKHTKPLGAQSRPAQR